MSAILNNFKHAFRGIQYALSERIFRIHCGIALIVVCVGFLLRITAFEFVVVAILIGWILTLEIMNTIVEHMVDLLKPEFHAHAKSIKDLASASVLVFALAAAIIACIIFLPKFVLLFYALAEWLVS